MKKLLISAYAVSPIRGSECAVGWEITTRLGEYFDVTVLMCKSSTSNIPYFNEITDYLKENGNIKNVTFIPIEMPKQSKKYTKLHDAGFWPAYYWGYKCWQKEVLKVAIKLHSNEKFDIAYQLNMIGFREPGYLWKLDIPFIWGPTNGFHSIPFSFLRGFNGSEYIIQVMKHIANEAQIKLSFRAKKAAKKAEVVWSVDKTALNKLLKWKAKAELMQETGLNIFPSKLKTDKHYDGIRCLNIVWSGNITSGKALSILINALVKIKHLNFHLMVIGDGPLSKSMKSQANPIKNKITWTGWINKNEAIDLVAKADLLIHSSLKEGTPHSILEAIANGVPVICHDTCGMGVVVNDKNGFKIPYVNYQNSIDYLSTLVSKIMSDPEILNKKFKTLWDTIDALTWENKVKQMAEKINYVLKSEIETA